LAPRGWLRAARIPANIPPASGAAESYRGSAQAHGRMVGPTRIHFQRRIQNARFRPPPWPSPNPAPQRPGQLSNRLLGDSPRRHSEFSRFLPARASATLSSSAAWLAGASRPTQSVRAATRVNLPRNGLGSEVRAGTAGRSSWSRHAAGSSRELETRFRMEPAPAHPAAVRRAGGSAPGV